MRRVLIDGTTISRQIDGLTQYILNVLVHWEIQEGYSYTLIVRPNACPPPYLQLLEKKGFHIECVNIAPIGPLRDIQFAYYLSKNRGYDVAFIPSNQFPIALRIPSIYTIHDLIYERFPGQLGALSVLKRWYLRMVTHVGLRRAHHVVAVSQYTRDEVLRYHGQEFQEKIDVVHEGWEHLPMTDNVAREFPRDVPYKNYILYVGSSREHKNLGRLIQAIRQCSSLLPADWGFVLVGDKKKLLRKHQQEISKINQERDLIYLTDWMDDACLVNYYRYARALILPSLCEGFGIPVLEAYYYHLPLLLSNQSSLPEVASDAAMFFNPYDVNDMVRTIIELVENPCRESLITREIERLSSFSWNKSAMQQRELLETLWQRK
jgi:glycosyltransferase involved in cell wall biosynthesis